MSVFVQIVSYLGAFFVAAVSIPELYHVLKTKKTAHINFLLFWFLFLGCVCFTISSICTIILGQSNNSLGYAVLAANVISGSCAFVVIVNKLVNQRIAKRTNSTEEEASFRRQKKK